jgi:SAM-dependent methyltransferase
MHLVDIVTRAEVPEPWAEGEKIPWDDPAFSRRMLNEHLSQEHDAASRRFAVIDAHVAWIDAQLLRGQPTRVLDLGCGPGFYAARLAAQGHTVVGIDFSPASIGYATTQAAERGLDCTFVHHDIRTADYGTGYGLVMLIFGEFNVFRAEEARTILAKAYAALAPGGVVLLEPHTFATVEKLGREPASWFSTETGLFAAAPHILLQESFWDEDAAVATERFYLIDAATGVVTRHAASMQAYTDAQYRELLTECGFVDVALLPKWGVDGDTFSEGLLVLHARKAGD